MRELTIRITPEWYQILKTVTDETNLRIGASRSVHEVATFALYMGLTFSRRNTKKNVEDQAKVLDEFKFYEEPHEQSE